MIIRSRASIVSTRFTVYTPHYSLMTASHKNLSPYIESESDKCLRELAESCDDRGHSQSAPGVKGMVQKISGYKRLFLRKSVPRSTLNLNSVEARRGVDFPYNFVAPILQFTLYCTNATSRAPRVEIHPLTVQAPPMSFSRILQHMPNARLPPRKNTVHKKSRRSSTMPSTT